MSIEQIYPADGSNQNGGIPLPIMPGQVAAPIMPGQVAAPIMPGQVAAPIMPGQVAQEQVAPIMPGGAQPIQQTMPGINTLTPEQMVALQAQNTTPVVEQQAAPVMAPVVEQQAAPVMAPVVEQQAAPVMAPVVEQQVAPVMAPVVEQQAAPVMAPVVEQQAAPVMAPVVEQQAAPVMAPVVEQQAAPVAQATDVPNIVGDVVVSMGGLDLTAGIMSPEDEVKLNQEQKEIVPISVGGLTSLATCKISAWGAFIKVLDFLAKDSSKDEVIMVEQGTLDTNKNGVFVHCDLKNVLGDITLNITSPSASTKLLKTIRGGEFVQILKDESANSYIFCNIVDGRVFTQVRTKFAAGDSDSFAKAPNLGNPTYQKEVSNSDKEIIKTIIEGKAAIESDEPYRFGFSKTDNTLVSIGVGKDFTLFFQDQNIPKDEYKVYYPFPVAKMDSCIIKLFKHENGDTWLRTVNNVELASIICTEKIEIVDTTIEDYSF